METTGGGPAHMGKSEQPVDPRVPSQPGGADGAAQPPAEHIFGGGPPAALYLPTDWLNFLADGDDRDAARRRYERLIPQIYPNMPLEGHQEIVDGLMLWRDGLWTDGFLAHGIISVPARGKEKGAFWQILVAAMKLPSASAELDTTTLLQRMVGSSDLDHLTHVEKYQTEMGLGLGLIGRPPITLPGGDTVPDVNGEPRRTGMATALSYAPGAEFGIIAIGSCLDPEQDTQLAMLVALIAGRSKLITGEEEAGQETAAPVAPAG
ncbi:hypothetical protein [Streptomyces profundus]|uniref:hypothetical protein n=1 Tax=Streptomyces profundus TaxID=2867410 RepID=UPI001D165D7E|nr:hypothetical protein [Streptomyces sp. MA3_2.13]UED85111.1 hypothetical protein K4G22_13650 [Streptomyces sp. MA3_2.13]